VLVTNFAVAAPDHWAVLSVFVDDTALPLAEPLLCSGEPIPGAGYFGKRGERP
jgi:hypothetical protein